MNINRSQPKDSPLFYHFLALCKRRQPYLFPHPDHRNANSHLFLKLIDCINSLLIVTQETHWSKSLFEINLVHGCDLSFLYLSCICFIYLSINVEVHLTSSDQTTCSNHLILWNKPWFI